MNTSTKTFTLLAATSLAFAASAKAQLVTYETVSAFEGSLSSFSSSPQKLQVFTEIWALKSLTFNFFKATPTFAANTFSATFGEWNGSGFVAGTTVSFSSITVPASNSPSWVPLINDYTQGTGAFDGFPAPTETYAKTFDLASLTGPLIDGTYGYLTKAYKTYAFLLTKVSGGGLALGVGNSDAFAYGYAKTLPSNFLTGGTDFTFSQISLIPIPESSTVASVATGLLVAGLVGYRVRQRRSAGADLAPMTTA